MKHLSLCSGIGGLDLAAEWAGFETVAQCEIDEYASKVLAKNFPGVVNLHDIRTVTARRLAEYGIRQEEITVISAGFPCQPYSLAGKGRGDRDERDLWGEVARVVGEVRPKWFVGENTPGLFARSNQRYFRRVLNDLATLGYSVGWGIWGACDVGAPHKRERIFLVAHSNSVGRKTEPFFNQSAFRKLGKAWGGDESCRAGCISGDISDADRKGELQQEREQPQSRRRSCDGGWWKAEPDVGRMADGVSHRVDRLRCLGNAVVPYQAYPIFKAIAEFERRKYDD